MNIETQVLALFEEGNPIPDLDGLEPIDIDAAAYLAILEQRSSECAARHKETRTEGWETIGCAVACRSLSGGHTWSGPHPGQPGKRRDATSDSTDAHHFWSTLPHNLADDNTESGNSLARDGNNLCPR